MSEAAIRFAICNELFQDCGFAEGCRRIKSVGFDGIEIAPFTLSDDPAGLTTGARKELRGAIAGEGLTFVGLHWLLAAPAGLQASTRDDKLRRRTWEYVQKLIDLCAELTSESEPFRPVVVFGSPKQRSSHGGADPKESTELFVEELSRTAPHAENASVTLLVEALPRSQSDVINTLAEAAAIVRRIGSRAVQTMFDVHNTEDETEPHDQLLERFFPFIRHVHMNEMDGREPGMGNYDFGNIMRKLLELNHNGWVSIEAFDFSRDPVEVASRGLRTLREAVAKSVPAGSAA